MGLFRPQFAGTIQIRSPGTEFLERFERRVQDGLLTGKSHWRAQYTVTRHSDHELAFRACSFMTAINVGLNEVELRIQGDQGLEYQVTYRRWAAAVVGHGVALGGLLGIVLIACYLLLPGMQNEIAAQPGGAAVFWGSMVFWGFLWPWLLAALLIPMHKRFARQCLIRIIDEVDREADAVSCIG